MRATKGIRVFNRRVHTLRSTLVYGSGQAWYFLPSHRTLSLVAHPIALINVVSQSTPMIEWHNNSHLVSEQKKMIVIKTHLNDKCTWQNDFFIENLSSIWSQKIL